MRRLSSRVGAGESWGEGGQGRAQRDRAVAGWGGLDRAGVGWAGLGWGGPGWAGLIGARQWTDRGRSEELTSAGVLATSAEISAYPSPMHQYLTTNRPPRAC